ncbi:hypothetical protein WEI85_09530 [Actinomycetes bacterium KLBMP 9797]
MLLKCALGAGLLLMAGCSDKAGANTPPPAPAIATFPAAAAGGACALLDYDAIAAALGVRFDVAAASRYDKTSACVVQAEGAARPDLMLSVVPSSADATMLAKDIAPDGATTVKGLGKAAYRATRSAAKGSGPVAEVAWLTADKKLLTLRYTLPAGEPKAAADALAGKLVTLAKQLPSGAKAAG